MLTASRSHTPEREKDVELFLSGLRERLMAGNFSSVVIENHITEEVGEEGNVVRSLTGGFTLTCGVRDDAGCRE